MKRHRPLVQLSVVFLFGALFARPPQAAAQVTAATRDSLPWGVTMDMVKEGEAIFKGNGLCTTCHGSNAEGGVGPRLADNDWLQAKGSYLSILQVILTGVPESQSSTGTAMPARGGTKIDDAQVQSAAAYIWKTSHPESGDSLPPGVTPEMVKRGEQVFNGPGACALCHGSEATGLLGPDLTDDVWLDAKGEYKTIGRIIAEGISEKASTSGIAMPPRGGSDISASDIERVAAYVWYVSHR
ncbi:MAG: cytochrome c [Gemmatimonadota bacterium]|nr:cytochrome c [Gemmatimonadota bacterium]MDH3426938.1 cytochrome c [Gemmatimonadota bacterium]